MIYGYQETIKLLWHHAYYDGPISGVCEIEGKKFWFDQIAGDSGELWVRHIDETTDITDDDSYNYDITRFYKIYQLPEQVMNDIIFNHEIFRTCVGHHTDYVNNRRELGCHAGWEGTWEEFKAKQKTVDIKAHLIDSNCIGWFDSNSRSRMKK